MRVALLTPTYWPEVRRGSERLVHDLSLALARRGHAVSVLTTHPARSEEVDEAGVAVSRSRRLPQRGPLRWYEHHITAALPAFHRLVRGDFDVAHAFFPVEAWAALQAQRVGGPPVVATFHGIPNRPYLVKRRYRLEMIMAAAERAAEVSVLSDAAAVAYQRYFGRRPEVLPGGVNTEDFAVSDGRAPEPTIVCAASLGDPRKRGDLLFEAFSLVRRQEPGARLMLVRTPDPVMSSQVGRLPAGAEWVEGDRTADLSALYASAWVSVLPSADEAFGLVLVESLAAGTPTVAARSGACPEIISDPGIGVLFEPDDPVALSDALSQGLRLSAQPGVKERCREAAAAWDWGRVVGRYEDVYRRVSG